jgi:hypothetical protein
LAIAGLNAAAVAAGTAGRKKSTKRTVPNRVEVARRERANGVFRSGSGDETGRIECSDAASELGETVVQPNEVSSSVSTYLARLRIAARVCMRRTSDAVTVSVTVSEREHGACQVPFENVWKTKGKTTRADSDSQRS